MGLAQLKLFRYDDCLTSFLESMVTTTVLLCIVKDGGFERGGVRFARRGEHLGRAIILLSY